MKAQLILVVDVPTHLTNLDNSTNLELKHQIGTEFNQEVTETCKICHKEFKDLYIHVKNFHRWNDCSQCDESFHSLNHLHNHLRSIHLREKNKCPYCGKDVVVNNFKRHITDKHQRVMKQCPHCDKGFRMSNLSLHIREEHSSGGSECPDCGKLFGSHYLLRHIKAVHNKVKRTCDICYKKVSVSNISFHKKKHHGIVFAEASPVLKGRYQRGGKALQKLASNENLPEDIPDGPIYQPRLDKVMKKERRRLEQKKYYEKNKDRIIANVVRWRKRTYVRKRTEKKLRVEDDPDDPIDFIMKTDEPVNVKTEADPWREYTKNFTKEKSKIIKVGNKSLKVKLL